MAKRILVTDDEPDIVLIIKTALQSEGYDVETASNGAECVEIAKANPPDLFMLDVMMPGMSGFDVVRALKAHEPTSKIPVIMLTGLSERQKIKEALTSGVEYYIVKPFEFEDLIAKVKEALSGGDI
ncbi:response regulator [Candidatus Sumerlaeota bacterium]|nr:response regulator [Candidatus Sumerlaeota bacterium]